MAATRQAGMLRLFMNGVEIAGFFSPVNTNSNASLKFGHRGNSADTPGSEDDRGFFLDGRIDEVQVAVGRAFSPAEIGELFQAGSAGHCKRHLEPRQCFPSPIGVTGWWPGDGHVIDIASGRNAVLYGDATTGAGLVDGAFVLDGDGDFVDVAHDPALNFGTGDFTIDLWAYFNTTADEQILAEKYIQRFSTPSEGWTLTKLASQELLLAMASADGSDWGVASPPLAIPTDRWVHFAATRRAGKITLFINGAHIATGFALLKPGFGLVSQVWPSRQSNRYTRLRWRSRSIRDLSAKVVVAKRPLVRPRDLGWTAAASARRRSDRRSRRQVRDEIPRDQSIDVRTGAGTF
jgi:hypothetical protein